MRDLQWSSSEKVIARKVFDRALNAELRDVIQTAKEKAARIKDPAGLWKLEHWLTQQRLEIDRKYDFRYSVLPLVFASLVGQGRLSREDLEGLAAEKIELIFGAASQLLP